LHSHSVLPLKTKGEYSRINGPLAYLAIKSRLPTYNMRSPGLGSMPAWQTVVTAPMAGKLGVHGHRCVPPWEWRAQQRTRNGQ
jgi:hypothetical protein